MANEVRLIDGNKAEAVLRNIADHLKEAGNTDLYPATYAAADVIKQQRTIDPESLRPKGRWVDHMVRDWRCSECGEKIHKVRNVDGYCYDDKPNYCPNCGAKMEG